MNLIQNSKKVHPPQKNKKKVEFEKEKSDNFV